MARVKRGVTMRARHKKIIKMATGYQGRAKNCFRIAIQRVEKALQYTYRDRRCRKRDMRALWIQRINAASRKDGMAYSDFMHALSLSEISINRKMLADMAVEDPSAFSQLVAQVKSKRSFREVYI